MRRKQLIKQARTIVVKVGTSVLTKQNYQLDTRQIRKLVEQMARLRESNLHLLLVTSGAIGAGMGLLGLRQRPTFLPMQQAMAAIGQSRLMRFYDDYFKQKGILTAQVLLTASDLEDRRRYLNARNTLLTLLKKGVIPIINENDTVSVDEIKFGDNDRLSSLVANLVNADLLIILSDIDGLHSYNNGKIDTGRLLNTVEEITPEIERLAGGTTSPVSTGGMFTKVQAAKIAVNSGIPLLIANGRYPEVLKCIIEGRELGTLFVPRTSKLDARKRWIAYTSRPKGTLVVDNGAQEALCSRKKSLLASGIVEVKGDFDEGDVVAVSEVGGEEFARGLVSYGSNEVNKIKGCSTSQIESILGYKYYDEVIHRDNLVILRQV